VGAVGGGTSNAWRLSSCSVIHSIGAGAANPMKQNHPRVFPPIAKAADRQSERGNLRIGRRDRLAHHASPRCCHSVGVWTTSKTGKPAKSRRVLPGQAERHFSNLAWRRAS